MPQKKIIHVDMDCFYAAVEMRDNPNLRGIPLAVGGSAEKRGVVATCNYEARKFGIHSAMASAKALKLCPHLKIIPGRMKSYMKESYKIREIFFEYTTLVEPLSLDEAYLDVTGVDKCGGVATLMAEEIRSKILEKTGLTASAGVAPNKFLAKVASDWKKPNGLFTLTPKAVPQFIGSLPIQKIPGVGRVTEKKLKGMGIYYCRDIQEKDLSFLEKHFGKFGKILMERSFGRDDRSVITDYPRKSLSLERTFGKDLKGGECLEKFEQFIFDLRERLFGWKKKKDPKNLYISKAYVKLKYEDFQKTTLEKTNPYPFYEPLWIEGELPSDLKNHLFELLKMSLEKSSKKIRLMGIGVRFSEKEVSRSEQLRLL